MAKNKFLAAVLYAALISVSLDTNGITVKSRSRTFIATCSQILTLYNSTGQNKIATLNLIKNNTSAVFVGGELAACEITNVDFDTVTGCPITFEVTNGQC